MRKLLLLIAVLFASVLSAQTVTVTAPNGGEQLYACQTYTITWSKTGSPSNYWDIDYSSNGGTTWTSIASNYLSAGGTFPWTVPNLQSSTVIVRIKDSGNPAVVDQSDANFTINIPVTVVSPNGTESWAAGTSHNITWTALGTSGSFNIYYSINGGSSWITIATNYTTGTGTYSWSIPNNPSTFCLVRVQDYVTGCMVDNSNANFTITAATPILITPNGTEVLYIGCSYTITWNTSTFYSSVFLEYSTNGGGSWTTIVSATSNTGSYNWIVPSTSSTTCLVRASNTADGTYNDVSNGVFTIAPAVAVNTPNGGETLTGCSTYTINWNKSTCIGNWNIYYSTNNGVSWTNIVTNLTNTGSNTQTYSWYVPNNLTSAQGLIKVESYSYPGSYSDVSNSVFTFAPNQNISVVSPNGSEVWAGCSSYTITWNKLSSPCNTSFGLYYSTNNGTSWNFITTVADNGLSSQTYNWSPVPNTINSTQCLIKVQSSDWANISDASNAVLTIAPSADVSVAIPNGGEVWQGLTSHLITWTNLPAASGLYTVQYSINNGASWNTLVTNYSGNSYTWTSVPNTPSTTCLIKVLDYLNNCKYDVSNATFTISAATPIVTAPNGGATYNVGCTTNITWNTATYYSSVNIYYSTDNGVSWISIIAGQANTGAYTWTIPNSVSSTCLIKVANNSDVTVFDISDATFSIAVPLTVTSANGGETWNGCSTYNITWNKSNCIGNWNIYYSINNGTSWVALAFNVTNNGATTQTYAWLVPNTISTTQALIKVENYTTPAIFDVSDAVFNITPSADVTVVTPNGGETLAAGSSYNITWTNTAAASGQYTLQYSTNGGGSWITIVTNITGNSYSWTVPNASSSTCLIKVTDYINNCKYDASNGNFTITPTGSVLLTPNGGETLYIGCTYAITWASATFISNVQLEYSTNNGASWILITSSTANTGTYNWSVPNTVSANCLVRASNTSNLSLNDVSDAVFTIAPGVTVTAPNGGETVNGCSTLSIIWNKSTCVGNWNIYYSTDNGATWVTIASNVATTGSNTQTYNWYVPNNLSSVQGLIRVQSTSGTYTDVSNASFTFAPNQNITVVAPNGGEVWAGCSAYNITWTKSTSPCNTSFAIYYSTNNGTSWNFITSVADNGTASQTYSWNPVPNTINSTQCLIKVQSNDWANISDASNTVLTIAPSADVTVTSPNGGEVWQGLSSHVITWTNLPAASGLYTVQYSTNNGGSWTTLVSNYSGNSYNWLSVPNTPSTTCLIKVIDYLNTCKYDISDLTFTISPATPILTSPNGGQVYSAGCSYSITWNAATYYSSVNLYYSTDNGATWNTIATSQTNSGAYTWTISPTVTPSGNCLVKVANSLDVTIYDISDANFTISVPLTLTSPNGGEAWLGCSTYNIIWNKSICIGNWNLYYSINNGASWNAIAFGVANTGSASQSYAWAIPNTITTTQALIKVENATTTSIFDVSDAVFSITPSNDIAVITPNGGETIASLSNYTITWSNTPAASGQYTLQYSTNGGASYVNIVTNITGNSYTWSVPSLNSTTCLIKVIDYINNCKYDASNAVFTITPPIPVLLTPNGGETLYIGCSYSITWNSTTFTGPVKLEYSTNGGITYFPIIASTSNTGSYSWTVPNTQSANCKVRASLASDPTIFDISDGIFTIAPAVKVTTPNGGETLTGCSTYGITWSKSTCIGNFNIDYSLNNGSTWTNIVTNLANSGVPNQTYNWYVPNNLTTTQGLIRIQSTSGTYTDQSDAVFNINPNNNITVVTPNGGETMTTCQSYNITWTKLTSPCNTAFDLYYSLNNGTSWIYIGNVADNGSASQTYSWTVPNTIVATTNQALVKVVSSTWSNISDQSNGVFTINPNADVTVVNPNGGEVWQGLTSHLITWTNSIFASGLYNVDYSTNGGTTWINIVTNYSGNSYNWSVPNSPSATCRVRVTDYLASCRFDISNANFTISPATPILITPNGGEVLNSGASYSITWNSTTFYSTVNLYYSTDNGVSYTTIATSLTNSGNYTWTVPNANSTQCLVKAANSADITVFDVSNAVFTIKPAVKILTPNGGENLGGCTVTSITFDRSPTWNTYKIEYSINNGASWILITSSVTISTNPATYNWTVPNLGTTQALIRVTPTLATSYFDVSDNVFNIIKPVTIIQPNFGGTMTVGSVYNITWSSDGISNLYDIFYSTNGGATFTNIVTAYNTVTNTYAWTVPATPSPTCKIWVRDNTSTCKQDTSDVNFTISNTPAPITLLTPNGGENLSGCSNFNITWSDSPVLGTYDLLYSTNSGTTWNTIVGGLVTGSSPHSYNWVVPNTVNSSTVLVRARSTSTPTTYDQSDALLGVHNGSLVASADTTICSGATVQLSATGGMNYNWSPAAGLSSTTISNPVASPTTTTSYIVQSINGSCILADTVNITVFAASVSITTAPSTSICAGTSVTFTANPVNGGTTPSYQWQVNGVNVGTNSPTYTSSTLANGNVVTVILTSNAPCLVTATVTSPPVTMNVTSIPVTPGTITGATPVCSGTSNSYSITAVGAATFYTWTLPSGWSGTSTTPTISTTASANSGNITVSAGNTCGSSSVQTLPVVVNVIPSTPGAITGTSTICSGTSNTYSVTPVAGATTYTWTLPGGWSGTSTTNSITTTASTTSGNITVTAGNTCGTSSAQTLAIIVNTTPAVPGTISGSTPICAGTTNTYSITAVAGAASYTWSTPSGWTGTSTTTSISTTASATSGSITVSSNNGCGSSTPQTLAVVVNSIPATPASIAGSATVCQGSSNTYSITSVAGATSYTWTLPGGWTGTSTTNSITTTAGATGGTIGVTANNVCGNSPPQTLAITVNPLPAVTASGAATICSGASTTLTASGGTTYSWLPTAGLSNPSIANPVATPASTTTYTVTGTTSGCSSTATVTITVTPSPIVSVSGTTTICAGSSTTLTATGASSFSWSPATGLSNAAIANPVASPASTTMYTVTGTTGLCSGTTTVTVTVNPIPVVTAGGGTTICSGSSTTLSASGGTTYSWLPTTGLSNPAIANPIASPTSTTTYTVTGTSLGCSATATVTVNVTTVPADAGADVAICLGGSTTLSASGGTTYSWSPATGLSATNIANPVANPTSTTTYTVTVTSGGCSATDAVVVTVNTLPSANAGSDVTINCGGTTTLSASGGTSYSWSPVTGLSNPSIANPVASPGATTTYTVTVTSGGCSGTDAVTVTVNALTANAGPDVTICSGTSTTLTGTITGSTPSYSWISAQRFGAAGADQGIATTTDASGNQYITGTFTGTVSFGSFSLTSSGYDAFTVKLNSAGVVQWAQKGGGTSTDEGHGIAVDPSGNVYVIGTFNSTATFGASTVTSAGSSDVFIAKYNSAGTIQWVQRCGSTTVDGGTAIAADASGAWITGNYALSGTFGSFTLTTSLSTDWDIFVAKYSNAGVCQWAQRGGSTTTSGDCGYGIGIDAAGNSYVTGYFSGTATFSPLTITSTGAGTDDDAFVAKYNSAGTIQWIRKGGIGTYNEVGRAITVDAAGNSYAVGQIQGTPSFGSLSVTSAGSTDAYLVKYNSSGTEQWIKNIGGASAEGAKAVCIDPITGNILVGGYSSGGTFTVGSTSLTGFGSSGQLFIASFTASGTGIFGAKSTSASPGGDVPNGIGIDNTGKINVVGTFGTSGASTTALYGTTTLTVSGLGDAYIAQLAPDVAITYAWSPAAGLSATNVANPVASPTSTTPYVLTVSSGACSSSDTVVVTVNTAPTASAGSPATICSGSSTTLNATGGTTYSWSPSTGLSATNIANPVASPTSTTTYTVTVGNGGSCTSTATVTITVNPVPVANAGSDVTIACGASTTLGASGGTSYSWSPTTGLSNPSIANPVCTPPYSITYTVTVSNGTCSSTDAVIVTTGTLTANAGPDVTICSGSSTTLNGSSTGGSSGSWVNLATSPVYTQNVGSYSPIIGGTVLYNTSSASMDDVVSGAITIPSFTFNNIAYTSIHVSTNGFITFGPTAPTTTNYTPISSAEAYSGAIAGFGTDLNAATAGTPEIRYQQVGPEFIIQWQDMGRYNSGGTSDRLSFQIRLNTTTYQIKVVYNAPALVGSGTTFDPEVGLRGPNNTFGTNVNNRQVNAGAGAWVGSTAGTSSSSTCYIDAAFATTKPAAGTTFIWTLPAPTSTTYAWTPPTGLSSTTITNPVANPTTTTTYTLTATNGSCSAVDQVTVTVLSAGSISAGPDATICAGSTTILNATGGGTYSWAPSTGLSATNIANPVASPTTTTTYTVTVSNGTCSFTDNVLVTVNPLPATPGAIAGSTNVCPGATSSYSISAVAGATSYTWTLPGGWTGTSTATSINVTNNGVAGTISVVANNACGSGTAQTLNISINTTPAQPVAITGSTTVCPSSSNTYSITAVPGATFYTWTLPGGWTGTSTITSINTIAGASGGIITVTANNACGVSTAQTLAVSIGSVPVAPASISGPTAICEGTSQTYTAATVAGATTYTWSLPGGWTGTSTTSSITVTVGASGGNVSVTADNSCGSSTPQTYAVIVTPLPSAPVVIIGNDTICGGTPQLYYVAPAANATSYTWILFGGWSGFSTTDSINTFTDNTNGTIMVSASNSCGTTTSASLNITAQSAPVQPTPISGPAIICDGTTNTYSVPTDANNSSYTWSLPASWTGSSTTDNISATAMTNSGNITVIANNGCGSTSPQTLAVTVNPIPTVTMTPMSTTCFYAPSFTLTSGSPAGGTYSGAGVSGGNTFTGTTAGLGTHLITYTYTSGGCTGTDTASIFVDICTSVATDINGYVNVYPNPFSEFTTMSIEKSIQLSGTEIHIFDVVGKEVMIISNINSYEIRIDRKDLRDGMYFYRLINSGQEIKTGKLIIE